MRPVSASFYCFNRPPLSFGNEELRRFHPEHLAKEINQEVFALAACGRVVHSRCERLRHLGGLGNSHEFQSSQMTPAKQHRRILLPNYDTRYPPSQLRQEFLQVNQKVSDVFIKL
jgi:hypothetical protein